jgi:hypothetical protein
MFCSRNKVPPGSVMRLRLVANSLAAIGILEELDQRECRGATVDDDALARRDEFRGRACDRALLRDAHVLAHRERHAHQVRLMARAHGFGAATYALHFATLGQRIDVAPDGRLGGAKQVQQIPYADDRTLFDELQNQVMPLFFQHFRFPLSITPEDPIPRVIESERD